MDLLNFELRCDIRPTDPRILLDMGPPKALYKVNPRIILGQVWWDKARKKAYSDFLNMCGACGAQYVLLQAHELYEIDWRKGRIELKDIVPLCVKCHSYIHRDLHRALLKKGALTSTEVADILDHGRRILRQNNLRHTKKNPNEYNVPFENWRLVLNGKEYAPVFEDNERNTR